LRRCEIEVLIIARTCAVIFLSCLPRQSCLGNQGPACFASFDGQPGEQKRNRLAKENEIRIMTLRKIFILLSLLAWLLVAASCDHSVVTGSKLTISNYDQITPGMSKAQVERILGPPTTVETKDMMIFKKTTYRYEDGKKFAMFTFKNDELDSKEGNLQRAP
jgi:hypothetical protein